MVGGFNTVVGLVAFAVFERWLGGTIHYLGALVLAYAVGICFGFVLHRRFVFRVAGGWLVDLIRFIGVQAVALALNASILPLMVEVVGLPVLPAQVLTLAIVVVSSYFGHALVSFRRPKPMDTTSR